MGSVTSNNTGKGKEPCCNMARGTQQPKAKPCAELSARITARNGLQGTLRADGPGERGFGKRLLTGATTSAPRTSTNFVHG